MTLVETDAPATSETRALATRTGEWDAPCLRGVLELTEEEWAVLVDAVEFFAVHAPLRRAEIEPVAEKLGMEKEDVA